MNIGIQINALTKLIYSDAKQRLKMANADPLVSEIIIEGVLSKFREDAYTALCIDTIANEAPTKSEVNKEDEQLAD